VQTKESKVLLASQREAQRVLDEAREEAQTLLVEAHEKALALLLRQQDEAARLLLGQQDDAKINAIQSMAGAAKLPDAERDAMIAQHKKDARALLETQQVAAELLVSAQEEAGVVLRESIQRAAANVLLTSHKVAAAILLDARMQVMDEWNGRETPPGAATAEDRRD